MPKRAWLITIALLTVAIWHVGFRASPATEAITAGSEPGAVVQQIWISELPEQANQKIDVFVMLEHPNFGQFLTTSAYEGDFAVFEWKQTAKATTIVLPQTGKHHDLTFKVKTEGCAPFDLCMTVKGAPRGAERYVSMREWVIEGADTDPLPRTRALLQELAAARQ